MFDFFYRCMKVWAIVYVIVELSRIAKALEALRVH